jgi:hypothetical protein
MATFNLSNKIQIVNPSANVDSHYGTYASLSDAYIGVPEILREKGKTVGILESGSVVEYWWKSGITDIDLVKKETSVHISGTTNTIPKFTIGGLGDSQIAESGAGVTIGGGYDFYKLNVNGTIFCLDEIIMFGSSDQFSAYDTDSTFLGKLSFNKFTGASFGTFTDLPVKILQNGTEAARISDNQNLLIGTTVDNGQKLQVEGDALINGINVGRGGGNSIANVVLGNYALALNTVGLYNVAIGTTAIYSNTTGDNNIGIGANSLYLNTTGSGNLGIGPSTRCLNPNDNNSIMIGFDTEGVGSNSVVLGNSSITKTILRGNVLIGTTVDNGQKLQVEGDALINGSLSSGTGTITSGDFSHAEGDTSVANGYGSHAEGKESIANGICSHAEGGNSIANGNSSHAEGGNSIANGNSSHAEGDNSIANGNSSHAEGYFTIADGDYQHVQGRYNTPITNAAAFIIGNGTDNSNRSNLVEAYGDTFYINENLSIYKSIKDSTSSVGSDGQILTSTVTGTQWITPQQNGLYAQTALSTPIVFASGEASLIGAGVGTLSVPANAFKVGDSFVAKMCGRLTCANNEILHIRVRSNGVLIIDALQYTLAATTDKYYDLILDFTVTKLGEAGVAELFANGMFTYNKNASVSMEGVHFGQISNTVFDTTVNNSLTITAEWVTSSATNTIRSQNFTLTKVY